MQIVAVVSVVVVVVVVVAARGEDVAEAAIKAGKLVKTRRVSSKVPPTTKMKEPRQAKDGEEEEEEGEDEGEEDEGEEEAVKMVDGTQERIGKTLRVVGRTTKRCLLCLLLLPKPNRLLLVHGLQNQVVTS
jgi:hypothetical protein